jgi:hypothetical protein
MASQLEQGTRPLQLQLQLQLTTHASKHLAISHPQDTRRADSPEKCEMSSECVQYLAQRSPGQRLGPELKEAGPTLSVFFGLAFTSSNQHLPMSSTRKS